MNDNVDKTVKERKRTKIPKWVWIPAVVIAGIILIPVIFIIFNVILFDIATGQINQPSEQQIIRYVDKNYREIESLSEELLIEYPDSGYKIIRGYDIDDKYHDDERFDDMFTEIGAYIYGSGSIMIEFRYKSTGISVSGSDYYLIYYDGDVPLHDFYGSENERVQTGENEWEWGDVYSGQSLKKIREKFYLSREWT